MKAIRKFGVRRHLRHLGPGLITGAADDDPSGIATYSQAGAQFGYAMLWTVVFKLPLMVAIQVVSARIGYVTRQGLTANLSAPRLAATNDVLMVVARFGTTISPYLSFWQAAQEVQDTNSSPPHTPQEVRHHLRRIKVDTIAGMTFSNLVAFFIILSTAATLHAAGITSAAGWQGTLSARLDRGEGRGFYAVIAAATPGGVILCFTPTDPVRELFWTAVISGLIAVPIMVVMMLLASRRATMGENVIGLRLRWLGWLATAAMAATGVAMLVTP